MQPNSCFCCFEHLQTLIQHQSIANPKRKTIVSANTKHQHNPKCPIKRDPNSNGNTAARKGKKNSKLTSNRFCSSCKTCQIKPGRELWLPSPPYEVETATEICRKMRKFHPIWNPGCSSQKGRGQHAWPRIWWCRSSFFRYRSTQNFLPEYCRWGINTTLLESRYIGREIWVTTWLKSQLDDQIFCKIHSSSLSILSLSPKLVQCFFLSLPATSLPRCSLDFSIPQKPQPSSPLPVFFFRRSSCLKAPFFSAVVSLPLQILAVYPSFKTSPSCPAVPISTSVSL